MGIPSKAARMAGGMILLLFGVFMEAMSAYGLVSNGLNAGYISRLIGGVLLLIAGIRLLRSGQGKELTKKTGLLALIGAALLLPLYYIFTFLGAAVMIVLGIYLAKNFKSLSQKRKCILCGVEIAALLVILLSVNMAQGSYFDRLVTEMLREYLYADNARAPDDSYLRLDTNPYDKDIDDMTYAELMLFSDVQSDTLDAIRFVNEKLGFSLALYEKKTSTSAMMGRQSEENDRFRVSWNYHPDHGLEVTCEKK